MFSYSFKPSTRGRFGALAARTLAVVLSFAGLTACRDNAPSAPASDANASATPIASAALTRLPTKLFVEPSVGSDANPGSLSQPFKTLARALSVAIAGDTVKLAGGFYSSGSNGEKFSNSTQKVVVPAGVRIEGTLTYNKDVATVISGNLGIAGAVDEVGLTLAGNAVVQDVTLEFFNTGIRAVSGQQTFTHLRLMTNRRAVELGGTARATLKNAAVTLVSPSDRGVSMSGTAQLVMDGGQMTGGAAFCRLYQAGIDAAGSSVVTLKNDARLTDVGGTALSLADRAKATLAHALVTKVNPAGCYATPAISVRDSAALTLRQNTMLAGGGGVGAVGIDTHSGGTLRIDTATVSGFTGAGVRANERFALVMNDGQILANGDGISAYGVATANARITINRSVIRSNRTGIVAPYFKLRNSFVTGNGTGIFVNSTFADLGTAGDPGNNRITDNTVTGVTFNKTLVCCGVFASGNVWIPGVQGANLNGMYKVGAVINNVSPNAHGRNFDLPSALASNVAIEF